MMNLWKKILGYFKKNSDVTSVQQLQYPAVSTPSKRAILASSKDFLTRFRNNPQGVWQLAAAIQGITIIILAGLLFYIYNKPVEDVEMKMPTIPPVYVEAGHPEIGTFEEYIHIEGTLKANEYVTLRPEVEGKIKEIYFTSGQTVKKGDKILKIEDAIYKAHLAEAEAKLELSRSQYERALALLNRQAGTVKDKDEKYAQWQIHKAEVEKAKTQLQKTLIVAPFDGIVGLKNLSVGAYVKPGDEIVILSDVDPMKAEFLVSETYLDKVQPGKEVTLEVDGFPDNVFRAKIEAIDANVDPLNHTLKVRATFPNINNGELKPGLFARIKLLTSSHENAVMLPDSAIDNRGTREFVYLVKNGVAVEAPVKTGGRNGEKVEVQAGVNPDDMVVFVGSMKLSNNAPVQIVPPHTLKTALGVS